MIELPTKPLKPKRTNPRKLLIAANAKIGKTSLLMNLENCLVLDLESGADQYEGMSVDIHMAALQLSKETGMPLLEAKLQIYFETLQSIRDSGHIYKYIAIDNMTRLEDMAAYYGTMLYKKTTIGKNFKGTDVISELSNGGGYYFLREAFDKLIEAADGLASECIIYVGHIKKSSIMKNDMSMAAQDLELTGKNRVILTSIVDATGFLRREKSTNKNILSFKASETDLITGARTQHLQGKEFLISEILDDGKFVTYWDKIFLKE